GKALAFAAHVHDDLGIGPVRFLPGLRLEVVKTDFRDQLNASESSATRAQLLPGLGLYVQARPWLAVFAGVHRGFSPVAPGQDDAVKAEVSWNLEGGTRLTLRDTSAEVVGFFSDYENLSGTCTFSSGCDEQLVDRQFNAGQVHVYGLEAAARQAIRLPASLVIELSGSYTWTGSRFLSTFQSASPQFGSVREGDHLPYVPEHRGGGAFGFLSPVGAVEVAAHAQSPMRDLPGQGELEEADKIPAHVIVDLSAEFRISDHIRLYTSLHNITNTAYMVSRRPYGARPGRPFHAMFGVKLSGRAGQPGLIELIADKRAERAVRQELQASRSHENKAEPAASR
ncbi:MAG TPA: hypothetical protein DIU15_06695, partial [Deltaproteobacteria bacterium]|nr:hypothetical protein [Deltaproteobacteria bacterium]